MKISWVLFIILLLGCGKSGKNTQNIVDKSFSIDVSQVQNVDWNTVTDSGSVELIPLETTDESLFGNVEHLFVRKDRYMIQANHSLYLFDGNGHFLKKISHEGKGPGEYLQLADAYLDENDGIYILDCAGRKIIQYDKEDKFIAEYKTGLLGRRFSKITNDLWGIYSNSDITDVSDCRLNLFSLSAGRIEAKYFPVTKEEYEWRYFTDLNNFQKTDSAVYFSYALNDTIYKYNLEGLQSVYGVLDFGSHSLSRDILNAKYRDVMDFVKKVEESDCVYVVNPIYLLTGGLFCGYEYKDKYIHAYYENGQVKLVDRYNAFLSVEGYDVAPSSIPMPLFCGDNWFYSILELYQIPEVFRKDLQIRYGLPDMNSDSNPYILKYKAL